MTSGEETAGCWHRGGRPSPGLTHVQHPANAAATREPGTFAYWALPEAKCLHVKGAERWHHHVAVQRTSPRTGAPVYPGSTTTRQHDLGQLSHTCFSLFGCNMGVIISHPSNKLIHVKLSEQCSSGTKKWPIYVARSRNEYWKQSWRVFPSTLGRLLPSLNLIYQQGLILSPPPHHPLPRAVWKIKGEIWMKGGVSHKSHTDNQCITETQVMIPIILSFTSCDG